MALIEEIQVDNHGRMRYHPEFHPNHGKPYSDSDLEYLCKYWEHDHQRTMAFALGRPEGTLQHMVSKLRKKGLYEYYKNANKYW